MVPAQINGTETEGIGALYGMTPEKIFSRDQAFPAVGMGAGPGSVSSLSVGPPCHAERRAAVCAYPCAFLGPPEAMHGVGDLMRTGHRIVRRQKCLHGFRFGSKSV